jgi:hypothetical protein
MLGYKEADIATMMNAMEDAIKSGRLSDEIADGLAQSMSFLEGLLSEGHFDE